MPIHAIGDKANDMLLDMVNMVVDLNGVKDCRFQLCSDSYFRIVSFPRTLLSIYLFWNELALFSRILIEYLHM